MIRLKNATCSETMSMTFHLFSDPNADPRFMIKHFRAPLLDEQTSYTEQVGPSLAVRQCLCSGIIIISNLH